MNYLQVKIASKVLEEKLAYCKQYENIQKEYSKEEVILMQEFLKEIQQITLK